MAEFPQPKRRGLPVPAGKTLVAIIGASAAALSIGLVQKWEGTKYIGYRDILGIPTKCTGDTHNVVVGRRYTVEECRASLEREMGVAASAVMRCTPGLKDYPWQIAAAVSVTVNIGAAGYCGSTMARRFNSGDWKGACRAFILWNKGGGRAIPGLTARRTDESGNYCMVGLR